MIFTQAKSACHGGNFVYANFLANRIEKHVAALCDTVFDVQSAMTLLLPAMKPIVRNLEMARAEYRIIRAQHTVFQGGEGRDHFKGRGWRIGALHCFGPKRAKNIITQGIIIFARYAAHKEIWIKARTRCHSQKISGCAINDHSRGGQPIHPRQSIVLDLTVDGQLHRGALLPFGAFQFAHHPSDCVHLNALVSRRAAQPVLHLCLNPGFANLKPWDL